MTKKIENINQFIANCFSNISDTEQTILEEQIENIRSQTNFLNWDIATQKTIVKALADAIGKAYDAGEINAITFFEEED